MDDETSSSRYVYLFLLTALLLMLSCTNESDTVRTLDAAGFTNIQTTGYSVFACGDDDTYRTGFKATNPNGKRVEGTVCCGVLTKGCTIRF